MSGKISLPVLLATLLTVVACASSAPPQGAPSVDATIVTSPEATTSTPTVESDQVSETALEHTIVSALNSSGVLVDDPVDWERSLFGVPRSLAMIGENSWLLFTTFPDEHFAAAYVASFDLDGGLSRGVFGRGIGLGVGTVPTFYFQMGPTTIEYTGDDSRVVDTIEALGARLVVGRYLPLAQGVDAVKQVFIDRGFDVTDQDLFALGMEMFQGNRSKFFFVDGEAIHVWEKDRFSGLTPRGLAPDGYSYTRQDETEPLEWDGTPYFFEQGGVALYVGENRVIVDVLRDIAGREIAGGDQTEAYPIDADLIEAQLRELGLAVERGDVVAMDSPFTTPGQLWSINGEQIEVILFTEPSLFPHTPRFVKHDEKWHSTPHLFIQANAAVFYVGENETIIRALERTFGWNQLAVGTSPAVRMGTSTGRIVPAEIARVDAYSRAPHQPGFMVRIMSGNGGCVGYQDHELDRVGNQFIITVNNADHTIPLAEREDGVSYGCTADLRSHTTYVPLVEGLVPGDTYTVVVNGVSRATFVAE